MKSARPSMASGADFRLGEWLVQPSLGRISGANGTLHLRALLMELLQVLKQNAGRLVSKEDIAQAVWGRRYLSESSLTRLMAELRRALGDPIGSPRYIETVPKKGYRLIASAAEPSQTAGDGSVGRLRMVVLPFANLSGDAGQEYLCDGLTEEMIGQLARIDGSRLAVIARTTSMHYKGTTKSARAIAKELEVDFLLEGSVRLSAGSLRVSAQLIETATEQHLWAKTYDGHLGDVLRFQEQVARAVASEIQSSLAAPPAVVVATEAYDAYIRGRFHAARWTGPEFESAIRCFEEAVAIQPNFAKAWAALAAGWSNVALWNHASPREAFPNAENAARRAIEMDESMCSSHLALGMVRWYYDWDLRGARRELERAVELSPSDVDSRLSLAIYLGSMEGNVLRAASEAEHACELDPLSVTTRAAACWIPFWARSYEQALRQCRATLELDPNAAMALQVAGAAARLKGAYDYAVSAGETAVEKLGDQLSLAYLGMTYALMGRHERARNLLRQLQQGRSIFPAYIHVGLGENRAAVDCLGKAFEEHDPLVLWLRVSPDWDLVRGDPGFQRLLLRLDEVAPLPAT